MLRRYLVLAGTAAVVVAAACDGENVSNADDDGAVSSAATGGAAVGSGGTGVGTGGTSVGTAVGGSSSSMSSTSMSSSTSSTGGMGGGMMGPCAGAVALTFGTPAADSIDPAGDEDYFVFSATAGDWILLFTDANPNDDPLLVDTVITLYDAGGSQQLAESDDATPRFNTDSELFFHVPQTGSYCVRVQEYSEWANMQPEGDPSFTYDLYAVSLDPVNHPFFTEDSDPNPANDSQLTAQPLQTQPDTSGGNLAHVGGVLSPGTDVDFYSFTSAPGTVATNVYIMPSGPDGHGSTQSPGIVRVRDTSGAVLLELDHQLGSDDLWLPSTGNTTYLLEVNRPNTTVGSNDFFYLKLGSVAFGNDVESESNDTAGQADPAPPQINGGLTSHFIQGQITPAGDVDYWSFSASAGDSLSVVCTAARSGSGLIGFTVDLRNPGDTATIQTETEVTTQDLSWAQGGSMLPVTIGATGTHYVRFSATGQQPGVIGAYYRCGLHLQ